MSPDRFYQPAASRRHLGLCGSDSVEGWSRSAFLALALLTAGIAVFYYVTLRPGQEAGDASIFLNHAINIAEGRPYTQSDFIANPEAPGIGGIASYPPGLPLVFSLVYALAGFDVGAFKLSIVLLFAGSLLIFGLLLSRRLRPGSALFVIAIIGLNPYFWDIKEALVSHIPFLFWTLLSLYLIDVLYNREGGVSTRGLALSIGIGASMLMAMTTRSVGIAIPAALGLYDMLYRRKWYPSWRVLLPLGVFGGLILMQRLLIPAGSTSSYFAAALSEVDSPAALLKSIASNTKNYVVGCVTNTLLDNGRWPLVRYLIAGLTLVLAAIGFLCRMWKRLSVIELFALAFSGIILVWPFLMIAYMIPMYFLLFFFAATAIDALTTGFPKARAGVAVVVALAYGVTYAGGYDQLDFQVLRQNIASEKALAFYSHVEAETPENALFISREAADFALYAKRRSMPPLIPAGDNPRYTEKEAARLFDFFERVDARYIVTGPVGDRYHPEVLPLWYLVRDYPARFAEMHCNSEFGLYALSR